MGLSKTDYELLDKINMEGDSMWLASIDDKEAEAVKALEEQGLVEWIEVGYDEYNPQLTTKGKGLLKQSRGGKPYKTIWDEEDLNKFLK
jgi:hypothetical protein